LHLLACSKILPHFICGVPSFAFRRAEIPEKRLAP